MAELGRFLALVAEAQGEPASFREITEDELGEGEVLVEIERSSVNYKDALAVTAKAPIMRRYPTVVGVDLAGRVLDPGPSDLVVGSAVLVAGCGLGEEHPGGFTRYARVPREWCVPIPAGLDAEAAMVIGTAGLTAMLCCFALERGDVVPETTEGRPVLVTGAAGGVGSFAVALLFRLGYGVVASTGRVEEADYLRALGADSVVGRDAVLEGEGALERVWYSAAIDVVGGATLAAALRRVAPNGVVAACGLAGSAELATTVYPFILRGVTLAGINSVRPAASQRRRAWEQLGALVDEALLSMIGRTEPLSSVPAIAAEVLAGRTRGRVVVDVSR